jgi:hypothetical protein
MTDASRTSANSILNSPGFPIPIAPGAYHEGVLDGERPYWWRFGHPWPPIGVFPPDILDSIKPAFTTTGVPATRSAGAAPMFSETELLTLSRALQIVKAARASMKSAEPASVKVAGYQLLKALAYVSGLFDGKRIPDIGSGLLSSAKPVSGPEEYEALLDQIERDLDDLTNATRGVTPAIGLGILSAAHLARGFVLKVLAEAIRED